MGEGKKGSQFLSTSIDNGLEYYNFIFVVYCLYLLRWGILKQSNNITLQAEVKSTSAFLQPHEPERSA
jgi:hypothetical protein